MDLSVVTTNNEKFTEKQTYEMVKLVYVRFGRDVGVAHSAWKRMLQNNCDLRSFQNLLDKAMLP